MHITTLDQALDKFALNRESIYVRKVSALLDKLARDITILYESIDRAYGLGWEAVTIRTDPEGCIVIAPNYHARIADGYVCVSDDAGELLAPPPPRGAAREIYQKITKLIGVCQIFYHDKVLTITPQLLLSARNALWAFTENLSFSTMVAPLSINFRIDKIVPHMKARAQGKVDPRGVAPLLESKAGDIQVNFVGAQGPGAPRDVATRLLLYDLRRLRGKLPIEEMIQKAAERIVERDLDEKPPSKHAKASRHPRNARPKSPKARVVSEAKRLIEANKESPWGPQLEEAREYLAAHDPTLAVSKVEMEESESAPVPSAE